MNICVVSYANRLKLIPLLLSAMTGRRKRYKGLRTYECREVRIHTDASFPVHVDGEVCGNVNDIQAECIPRKVRIGRMTDGELSYISFPFGIAFSE